MIPPIYVPAIARENFPDRKDLAFFRARPAGEWKFKLWILRRLGYHNGE
jgi:hypothetical protein